MHVVIVNRALADEPPGAVSTWFLDDVHVERSSLFSQERVLLADVDVVVVDTSRLLPGTGNYTLNNEINEFVAGGGCLIVFVSGTSLEWLPTPLSVRTDRPGTRILLNGTFGSLLSELVSEYRDQMGYQCDIENPAGYEVVATSMTRKAVVLSGMNGRVMVLPPCQELPGFVNALFSRVVAGVMRDRWIPEAAEDVTHAPPWLSEFSVAGTAEIEAQISDHDVGIRQLQTERETLASSLRDLDALKGLLWQKGKRQLEPAVRQALNMLGVPCEAREPYDAIYEGPGGPIVIEIEGSKNEISVDKARQLLEYKARSPDPASFRGVIIGNPFCEVRPDERANSRRPAFSPQCAAVAAQLGWPLLTTVELWNLVQRHLQGDDRSGRDLHALLGIPIPEP